MRAPPLLHSTVLIACCLGAACSKSDRPRINVLLVSLDSLRKDTLSCYGRVSPHAPNAPTSPNLDRLASEGVRFGRAYTTTSWTLPSHMALMTGQTDLVHAVEMDLLELTSDRPTLASALHEHGFRTAGFYSGPYLEPRYGFERGFEHYEACYGPRLTEVIEREHEVRAQLAAGPAPGRGEQLLRELQGLEAAVQERSHLDVSAEIVTDRALEELRVARDDERPWFLFVHYFDPHFDYAPPAPFDARFDPDYGGDISGAHFADNPRISIPTPTPDNPQARERKVSDRDLEHVRALYDGELAWTDHQIGRLIDDLRAHDELENTIVVVLSDHGEEFFEHGGIGHRTSLYEEVVQIPLIVRYPEGLGSGIDVDGVVGIADVFATLFELLDLPLPAGLGSRSAVPLTRGESPSGRSAICRLVEMRLVGRPGGGTGNFIRIEEAFVDWPIKIRRVRRWVDPFGELSESDWKRAAEAADRDRSRDRTLAWIDLEASPEERPDQYSSDFADPRARAALELYREEYERALRQRVEAGLASQDESQRRRLEALGYAGGPADPAQLGKSFSNRLTIPAPEVP